VRPTRSWGPGSRVDTCERCGRILFPVAEPVVAPAPPRRRAKSGAKGSDGKRSSA
jgi:hypothetical protein